VKQKR